MPFGTAPYRFRGKPFADAILVIQQMLNVFQLALLHFFKPVFLNTITQTRYFITLIFLRTSKTWRYHSVCSHTNCAMPSSCENHSEWAQGYNYSPPTRIQKGTVSNRKICSRCLVSCCCPKRTHRFPEHTCASPCG